jgi:hypothetical protein
MMLGRSRSSSARSLSGQRYMSERGTLQPSQEIGDHVEKGESAKPYEAGKTELGHPHPEGSHLHEVLKVLSHCLCDGLQGVQDVRIGEGAENAPDKAACIEGKDARPLRFSDERGRYLRSMNPSGSLISSSYSSPVMFFASRYWKEVQDRAVPDSVVTRLRGSGRRLDENFQKG